MDPTNPTESPPSEENKDTTNQNAVSTPAKPSRRQLLEAFLAQKAARKAEQSKNLNANGSRRSSELFGIVPSAIHQKCKEQTTHSGQPKPSTPLVQQQASQASKLLNSHPPRPSMSSSSASSSYASSTSRPTPVPQTAPRSQVAQSRTSSIAAPVSQHPLFTPQGKSSQSKLSSNMSQNPTTHSDNTSKPTSSQIRPQLSNINKTTKPSSTASNTPLATPSKKPAGLGLLSEAQRTTLLNSSVFKGLVDAVEIKLLEGIIHRRCIFALSRFCPRDGDNENMIQEKYNYGKELFDTIAILNSRMIGLIAKQKEQGIKPQEKPFKTGYYYVYRAIFEEWHANIVEATSIYEEALTNMSQPSKFVHNAFRHFVGRIKELTQQQMAHRPSLAFGVRKLQQEEQIAAHGQLQPIVESDSDDLEDLMDLLDDADLEQDFGTSQLQAIATNDSDTENDDTLTSINKLTQTIQPTMQKEAESTRAPDMMSDEIPEPASPEPVAAPAIFTPSKLNLNRTPMGLPRRRILYQEDEEQEQKEVDAFMVVYEKAKAPKSSEVPMAVTPMRRSRRLNENCSANSNQTDSVDELLAESGWSYQPNEALLASGRMAEVQHEHKNPESSSKSSKKEHLVSMAAAKQKLTELRATRTPTKHGPAMRVSPLTHPTPEEEEEAEERMLNWSVDSENEPDKDRPTVAESQDELINEIAAEMNMIDIASAQTCGSNDDQEMEQDINVSAHDLQEQFKQDENKVEESVDSIPSQPEPSIDTRKPQIEEDDLPQCTPKRRGRPPKKHTETPSSSVSARSETTSKSALETPKRKTVTTKAKVVLPDTPAAQESKKSLYETMRRAAYSGSYGSTYVATPDQPAADSSATPTRRSRRIAAQQSKYN